MSMTDPIADLLTRIRNAQMAAHEDLEVPYSHMKLALTEIMVDEGYLAGHGLSEADGHKTIKILIKYGPDRQPAIRVLRRVSKPGRRVYVKHGDIPSVLGGLGINILSTSKGVMTGKSARRATVGGEILCEVY